MSLKVTRVLLIIGALAWASLPWLGLPVFAAAWLVLALGTWRRHRAARAVFEGDRASLEALLAPATLAWAADNALFYVWPQTAARWAKLWQLTILLAALLAPWFLLRALFLGEWRDLTLLVGLGALFISAGSARLSLTGEKVNHEEFREHQKAHGDVSSVLAMRAVIGKWPPLPEPDVEGAAGAAPQGSSNQ
jgi:hypothetical protein